MSAPIAFHPSASRRLAWLFALSVGVHLGFGIFAMWAGRQMRFERKPEAMLDLGMDVTLGEEMQEAIAAPTPPPPPEPPEPPPPERPESPVPEPLPAPAEKPDFFQIAPAPKTTPAPKPKVFAKRAPETTGAKTGPTPRAGVAGGNVSEGNLTGTPGGKKLGEQGWRTPRPPYPPAALAARIQGAGAVRISTDASGNVTGVVIVAAINPILDANTRSFARGNWKGPPNSTRTVPVIYQIR